MMTSITQSQNITYSDTRIGGCCDSSLSYSVNAELLKELIDSTQLKTVQWCTTIYYMTESGVRSRTMAMNNTALQEIRKRKLQEIT